jgi:vacuolar-type H+-ATPase subunit B/Vma2
MATKDILAIAQHFCVSQDVVNVRTVQGQKYRGYVDKAQANRISVIYFAASRDLRRSPQRVTLLPKDIVSINVSKAYN